MRMHRTLRTIIALSGALVAPGAVVAQQPPLLRGVVVDTTGVPISQADIIAIGQTRRTEGPHYARTDESGRFVFPRLEPGAYTITVRRIGFVPIQAPVTLAEDAPRNIRFEMERMPQVLADLVVEGLVDSLDRNAPLFQGVVVDSAGRGIPQADIMAAGAELRTRGPHSRLTNLRGQFTFEGFPAGRFFVTVRRVGYVPIRVALTFEARTPRNIRFVMQPMPQHLADVNVRGDGFDLDRISRRVSAGAYRGTLLTRDDLERMAPRVLGDAVRTVLTAVQPETFDEPNLGYSHLWVRPGNDPLRLIGSGQRGRDCPPVISINGRPTRPGWAINDFNPEHIEAMEIYRGFPPFPFDGDTFVAQSCGQLVIIWLRPGMVIAPQE